MFVLHHTKRKYYFSCISERNTCCCTDKDKHCHLNPGAVHRVHDGVPTKTNRIVYMLGRGWSQTNKPGLDEQDHQHTKRNTWGKYRK